MVYDCLGVELPEVVKGYPQVPLEGVSLRSTFEDADAPTPKDTAFFSMLGSRAIWHKGWKAVAIHPAAPSDWSHFGEDRWELYDTESDRTEMHDLAEKHPEKLRELIDLWYHAAGRYNGLPLDDRTALEILGEERPQLTLPRERYIYRPGLTEVPEASAANIRNRSFTIAAEVEIADANAGGVVFAHGSRFGGHALYLKDGALKYVNNFCGITEQTVVASGRVPTGKAILSAVFEKDADSFPATGTLTLYVDDEKVGEGEHPHAAREVRALGRGPQHRTRRRRPGHPGLPGRAPVGLLRRRDQRGRRRRLRRALHRSREGGGRRVHAGLTRQRPYLRHEITIHVTPTSAFSTSRPL